MGLNLLKGQAVANAGVGETDRAIQVAGSVDLDQSQAHVLLVLRAQAAVQGTAVVNLGTEFQRMVPGLLNLTELTYISASELMIASNQPWVWHRFRMKTRLSL